MRLIDANAMMKRLKAWDTNDAIDKALYNFALSRVLEAPTVVPERKTGKWINRSLNILYPEWERYTCSVCGKHSDNYDYCPNCGADMRGEQNDDQASY